MKILDPWILLCMLGVGLIHGRGSLHAQPSSEPVQTGAGPAPADGRRGVIDEPDTPWSRGVSAAEREAARELFMEGNRLFRIPLFAKAAEKYAAALSTWKHPAIYFNLALAQLSIGRDIEARETLEHAVAYGPEPLGDKEYREARRQLEQVKRQLGRVRVTCRTRGAEVTMDGATLFIGPGSYDGWAKARAHELTAKKAGYQSEARRVQIRAGQLQEIDLSLVTLTQAADTSRRWSPWKPWAVTAAGGAIAVSGGIFHTRSARNFKIYDREFAQLDCVLDPDPKFPGCTESDIGPGLTRRLKLARRQQMVALGGYMVGGAVIATGAILLYLNRPRLTEQGSRRAALVERMAITPTVFADMFGIQIGLSH